MAVRLLFTQRTPANSVLRKELMYMLHSRRKAEIEILYTAGETVGDSSFETQSSLPPMSGDPAVHGSPLLHYLIKKITASVAGS